MQDFSDELHWWSCGHFEKYVQKIFTFYTNDQFHIFDDVKLHVTSNWWPEMKIHRIDKCHFLMKIYADVWFTYHNDDDYQDLDVDHWIPFESSKTIVIAIFFISFNHNRLMRPDCTSSKYGDTDVQTCRNLVSIFRSSYHAFVC